MPRPLQHTPARPPRAGIRGENLFANRWAELMAGEECWNSGRTPLECVLGSYGAVVRQREATVAASIVCWLGTNMGRCLLDQARRLTAGGALWDGDAYVAAWAVHNQRKRSVNGGARALELMLQTTVQDAAARLPRASADDYEVAEHVMRWLGTRDGQAFLNRCETELDRHAMLDRLAEAARLGRAHLPCYQRLADKLVAGAPATH